MAYPSGIDVFSTKVDGVDDTLAAHMNAVQSAIVAVETELGTGLKGSVADLAARLAVSHNNDGTLKSAQVLAGIGAASLILSMLSTDSVDSSKVVNASLTGSDIAATTITGSNIAATTIATGNIQNGAITGVKGSTALATKGYSVHVPTIPTIGAIVVPFFAPVAGVLAGATFGSETALAINAANYITFAIRNWASGAGTNAMLDVVAANQTISPGGTAIVAHTPRPLTLHSTPGNLVVAQGDYLLLTITVTGTLGGALTDNGLQLLFTHTN